MKQSSSFKLVVEALGPLFFGILSLVALIHFRTDLTAQYIQLGWKLENLYSAVFGWASIQTGFLFGVYGFVVGNTDGFISEVRGTRAMSRFVGYTLRATLIGFILTLATMPLIVADPSLTQESGLVYYLIAAWLAIFVWAFMAFLRVAYIFGLIVRVKRDTFIGG